MFNYLIDLINLIITAIGAFISTVVNLLPPSPFKIIDNSPAREYMGYLNWIIPVNSIVTILETWLLTVGLYYLTSIALKWVKAIK